ncbi:MAG: ABC transporter permease, partial [Bacteroidia bacterium]
MKNYFTIGIRNLLKRKGYSLLNILGLTTGMACCLLIFHYVSYERSFDKDITGAENIYRIRLDNYKNGALAFQSATSYPGMPNAMKKDFPEVEEYCKLIDAQLLLSNDAKNIKFNETSGYYAEQNFLNMFGVKFLSGNSTQALVGPNKIVVSENMAKKYFGTANVLGKMLVTNDGEQQSTYEISGVFKAYPKNSHLAIEYLVSFDTFKKLLRDGGDTTNAAETSFDWYDFYSYIKLKPGTKLGDMEAKFPAFNDRHMKWQGNKTPNDQLHLTPLTDIHLYSNFNQEAEVNGNGQMVSFLFMIAIFIICIAWINYINLSTARSVERAKEVGMKKVLGAMRSDLIKQFLVENFLLNSISLIISVFTFFILVKSFDSFSGRETYTGISLSPAYWQMFIALFIGGSLLSGLYPAFVLSGFQPIKVLKGAFKNTSKGVILRKSLIVTQFVITVVLIAGTIIVYQQVQYMRKQNLGADINQTLVIKGPFAITDSVYKSIAQAFKTELLQQTNIKHVTASTNVMGQEIYWTNGGRRLEAPKDSYITLYNLGVDYDFIPAYNMKLKVGRNFSKDFGTDKKTAILNEKAVTMLGFKDATSCIGKKIRRGRDTLAVIGVLADYHHQGLQKAIDPMIVLP